MYLSKLATPAALITAMAFPATCGALEISILSGSWNLGSGWGPGCTNASCNGEGDVNGQNPVTGNHTLLNMDWSIHGGLSQPLSLASGTPLSIIFGSGVFRDEDNKLDAAETDNLLLAAILNLSVQSTQHTVNNPGAVTYATGSLNDGDIDLSALFEAVTLDLGTLGLLAIDFSDPAWTCNPGTEGCGRSTPQTRTINATFTWTAPSLSESTELLPIDSEQAATVAEPASLALFGLGLAAIGYQRRKRAES